MNLLIVDRSELFSQRLIELLMEQVPLVSCRAVTDGDDIPGVIEELKPEVVLLELSLFSHRTIGILQLLRNLRLPLLVMVTFIVADAYTLEQCREAGAHYLIDKYADFEKIADILKDEESRRSKTGI